MNKFNTSYSFWRSKYQNFFFKKFRFWKAFESFPSCRSMLDFIIAKSLHVEILKKIFKKVFENIPKKIHIIKK